MQVLLARLFGAQTKAASKTLLSDAAWRAQLKNLLGELHKYQLANVRTDEFHELVLASGLASADAALTQDIFWPGYIEGVVRFALTLMGDYPDHRRRKRGRKKAGHYDLNLHRSIAFHASSEQRYRSLYQSVDLCWMGNKSKMWELMGPFYKAYGTNRTAREKLDWFRKTYPQMYSRAFP